MPERFPYHRGLTIPTCITVRARRTPWCMSGSLTTGFLWSRLAGKTFPAFPAHAQPAIFVSDKSPMDNYHFHGHSHKKSGQNAKSLINYDFIDSILTLSFSVSFYCLETYDGYETYVTYILKHVLCNGSLLSRLWISISMLWVKPTWTRYIQFHVQLT